MLNTCVCLLLAVGVTAKSLIGTVQKDDDGDTVFFIKYDFDMCYYLSESTSRYLIRERDSVHVEEYLNSSDCSGIKKSTLYHIDGSGIKKIACNGDEDDCTVEIKYAPRHKAFQSLVKDEDGCPHRDSTARFYVTSREYKCSSKGYYCKFVVDDDSLFSEMYPNEKCDEDELIEREKEFDCDKCEYGRMNQCGVVSTAVVATLFVIALIF